MLKEKTNKPCDKTGKATNQVIAPCIWIFTFYVQNHNKEGFWCTETIVIFFKKSLEDNFILYQGSRFTPRVQPLRQLCGVVYWLCHLVNELLPS